jgi:hypothetical protein
MRIIFAPLAALVGIAVIAAAIAYLLWDLDWRWRPHTVTKNQGAIATALAQAGWVSPHLAGPKVYVITAGDCGACAALTAKVLPGLQAKEVDTRVIVVAPADENGRPKSTAQARALVAELWANRNWKLYQQWASGPPPPAPAADGDAARTAIVEASRALVATLTAQLGASGVRFAYPTLIWWTKDGRMRACACTSPKSFRFVDAELGG